MSSSFNRIKSSSIKLGDSFVMGGLTDEESVKSFAEQKKNLQKEVENLKIELQQEQFKRDNLINNAEAEAQKIIEEAKLQAQNIIDETNAQKEELVTFFTEEGRQQGYQAGFEQGQNEMKQQASSILITLDILARSCFEVKNEIIRSAEQDILDLSLMIAEKVAQIKFENDKECFENILKSAILQLKEKEDVKIVVNPKFVDLLYSISEEITQQINGLESVKIIQDKTISSDGLIVESLDSRVDARIEMQIKELARKFVNEEKILSEIPAEIEQKIDKKLEDYGKSKDD